MADEAPKSPQDRVARALDAAYDEHVLTMFKTLIANCIDASSAGSSMTQEQAVGMFARGMKIGWSAYLLAQKTGAEVVG